MQPDMQLQRDIEAELEWEPSIDAREIRISVNDGSVSLTGSVPAYPDKIGAEIAVERLSGVKAVRNDIAVILPEADIVPDELVSREVQAMLAAQLPLWVDRIKTTVSDRVLTLEGDVEWHFQKEAIEAAVRRVRGIEDVIDKIRIEPRLTPTRVQEQIELALRRAANLDARSVTVTAKRGAVTLQGETRSWRERSEVERAAWSAPGVWSVDNRIVVSDRPERAA
jgi:osmotically-inducible protein OsmY